MPKKLISVLGSCDYKVCTYEYKNKTYRSRFVQEAILNLCFSTMEKEDKILILYTNASCGKDKVDHKEEIASVLKNKCFGHVEYIDIGDITIQENIETMILKLDSLIESNDEIYIDVTHGLRPIIITVLSMMNYVIKEKHIKIAGIYYGAFECRKNTREEVPILRLSLAEEFLTGGNECDNFSNR